MSWPGVLPERLVVDEPVMLIDVSPTILALCGIEAPGHYEGLNLAPAWSESPSVKGTTLERRLPERPILSETKVQYENQALKMVALNEWKLIRSVLDGREELYHLPDEQTNLSGKETRMQETLSALARRWIGEEDFWMLHAHGPGQFTVTLSPHSGQFLRLIPFGEGLDSDSYGSDANVRTFHWSCVPGERTKSLFLQAAPAEAAVHFEVRIDDRLVPDRVFIGPKRANPGQIPFDLALDGAALSDPVIEKPFQADKPGFYVFRHRGKGAAAFPALGGTLDEKTILQLRDLGYLR
jgi:hypothetical protein